MTMPARLATLLAIAILGGCSSAGDRASSFQSGANELGSGVGSSFQRSSDTLGTQRRMDVYGGATAPVLPTIGALGYGK